MIHPVIAIIVTLLILTAGFLIIYKLLDVVERDRKAEKSRKKNSGSDERQ